MRGVVARFATIYIHARRPYRSASLQHMRVFELRLNIPGSDPTGRSREVFLRVAATCARLQRAEDRGGAKTVASRFVDAQRAAFGDGHADVGRGYVLMGQLALADGDSDYARHCCDEALRVLSEVEPAPAPDLTAARALRAALCGTDNRPISVHKGMQMAKPAARRTKQGGPP